MLYRLNSTDATASHISGRSLVQQLRHLSKTEKAFFAADIYLGRLRLDDLTVPQLAAIMGVNRTYITAALAASPTERSTVLAGFEPLLKPKANEAALVRLAKQVDADRWLSAGVAAGL
jgi:hypothetical protein